MSHIRDNINTVLSEKVLQFRLPSGHTVLLPAGEAQVFAPIRPPRSCYHTRPRRGLLSSGRPEESRLFEKGRDGCEQSTSQLHACLEGKGVEEVRGILEREVEGWVTTSIGAVTGFAPALAAFLGFTVGALGAAIVLCSAFSALPSFYWQSLLAAYMPL